MFLRIEQCYVISFEHKHKKFISKYFLIVIYSNIFYKIFLIFDKNH